MSHRYRIAWLLPIVGLALCAAAAPPGWWTSRGVLTSDPPNDYAPATAGQLKHIASMAKAELDHSLPGGAGAAVNALVASFENEDNLVPVNLGQLKHVAKPFYDRLIAENLATDYPWTLATADDRDFAPANIGQVKHVFAFNLDTDGDKLPNWWEAQNGLNPTLADADSDHDLDLLPAWAEYKLGTPANQYTPSVEKIGDAVTIEYRSARVTRDKVAFPAFKRDAQAGIRRRYTEFTGSGTFDRSCADDWRSYGEWSLQRNVGSVSVLSPLIGDFVAAELHSRSCAQPPPPSHGWDQTYSAASTAAGMWTKTYAHAANLSPCAGNETEGGTVGWAWDPLEIGWNIGLGCIIDLYAAYIGVPTDYWPFSPPPNVTLWEPTEFEVFGFSEHGGSHQFHLDNEYTTTMLEVNTYNDLALAPALSTLPWSEGWHKRVELEGYAGVDDWTLGASYLATETVAAYTAACWVVDSEQVRCERARIEYRLKVQTEPNIVNRVNVYEIFADTTGAKSIARTVPAFVMGTGQEVILEDPDFVIHPPASKGWQYPTILKVDLTSDPYHLAAESDWTGISDSLQRATITVSVEPPEVLQSVIDDITLELSLPAGGQYNPGSGSIARDATDHTKWIYTPFVEPQTEKHPETIAVSILPKYNGQVCGEAGQVQVKTVFGLLTTGYIGGGQFHSPTDADYNLAWQYVKWKYSIATCDLDSIAYDSSETDRARTATCAWGTADCYLGPGAFANENGCASTLGHEQIHGGQGYWYIITHQTRGPSHNEVPAYQWEIDNATNTGISAAALQTATEWRDYYNGTTNTPPAQN